MSNDCPPNVILDDTLCLKAGQTNPAGTVSLKATPDPDSAAYDFCVTINLDGWTLQGNEPIKAEFSTQERPGSNPGQYSYKYPNGGIIDGTDAGTYVLQSCLSYTESMICDGLTLYFAIHLDVTSGSDSETAWALDCEDTDLSGNRFLNKKETAFQGWGKYFVWTPCCPNDPGCDQCNGNGGGPGGDFTCDWTCTDSSGSTGSCGTNVVPTCPRSKVLTSLFSRWWCRPTPTCRAVIILGASPSFCTTKNKIKI